ncbi:chondroitinase family polysaccharide lyase [Pontiella desulfatans]|nr:chondroitinase family polysaccharide lyase [Pontiella desulfatans]
MRIVCILHLLAGISCGAMDFPYVAEDPASPMLSFESGALPASLSVQGAEVELSGKHFINGSQSLRWSWKEPSNLYFDRVIPYVTGQEATDELARGAVCIFSFWVYSEKALPGARLRIDFGRNDCGFDFGLGFTGWRTCSVAFDRDMEGIPQKGMRGLRITAPSQVASGELFIDRIILANIDDIRYQWADPQVPFVKGTKAAPVELTPLPRVNADHISDRHRADLDRINNHIVQSFLPAAPASLEKVAALEQQFETLEIREEEGIISGRHVLMMRRALHDRQDSVYPRRMTAQDEHLMSRYTEFRDYTELMQEMAQCYRALETSDPAAARLREMYLQMNRHLLDQGWQDGSALFSTHHYGYASRGWYISTFLMADELGTAGMLDSTVRALIWFMREKVDFAAMEFDRNQGADLDYINTIAKSHLLTMLAIPDEAVKVALVTQFRDYFSAMLAADTPGTMGGIKVDGTAFHHGGNYPGYSFPAFISAGFLCRALNDTAFAIRPAALENFSAALTAATLYSSPETGMALSGRHPFGESSIESLEPVYQDLEICGYPVALDRNRMPSGHWSFNYGCFGIHRWGGKMVTLKGFNHYVWSSEIYTMDNRYGRYQSNGSLQIYTAEGRAASGFEQEGWDWNRNPGTTMIHRPLDVLENPLEGTLMVRSDIRFGGSSNLGNRYGIFATDLFEPDMENFDPDFNARKSMFCFDNRIICLGAGISNGTSEYPTETVLFQHTWNEGSSRVWMNASEPLESNPVSQESNRGSWLVDSHGNGYYVPAGNQVKLAVKKQGSRHNKTKEPTEGTFASAWIDHGKAPKEATYEYVVLLDGTHQSIAAFASDPSYRVLRNDAQAQIVYDRESGVVGYALFDAYQGDEDDLLQAADQPCLVMAKSWGKNLALSIGNADLRIPAMGDSYTNDEEARPGYAEIVLRGKWRLVKENADVKTKVSGGRTRVVVNNIRHAIPVQLKFTGAN